MSAYMFVDGVDRMGVEFEDLPNEIPDLLEIMVEIKEILGNNTLKFDL